MTRLAMRTRIRLQLGESDTDYFTDARLNAAIDVAQAELAKGGQYVKGTTSQATTTGTAEYDWPANAIDMVRVTWDSDDADLEYRTADQLDQDLPAWRSDGNGTPWCWLLGDTTGKIMLYPKPDGAKTLKMYWWGVPSDLSLDTDSPVFPAWNHQTICDYATYWLIISDPNGDQRQAAIWLAQFERGKGQLMEHVTHPVSTPQFITGTLR